MEYMYHELHPEQGLPEPVFEWASTLMPIPNVDLLILDKTGRVLLSWRDDRFFGRGWHIPGGCIRFRETMLERVQRTAQKELGCRVTVNQEPIAVRDSIVHEYRPGLEKQDLRAHHLAVMFLCSLPEDFDLSKQRFRQGEAGFLKWFSKMPPELLRVHDIYHDVFVRYGLE